MRTRFDRLHSVRWAASILVAASALWACGSTTAPSPTPLPPATDVAATPGSAAALPPAVLPDRIEDLTAGIPAEASAVLTIPSRTAMGAPSPAGAVALLAKAAGLPADVIAGALTSFDGAALFNMGELSTSRPSIAALVRFGDGKAVNDLIAALKLEPAGENRYTIDAGNTQIVIAWLPGPRVAVIAMRDKLVDAALDTLRGTRPSFATSGHAKKADKQAFVYADLHALLPGAEGALADGSRISGLLGLDGSELAFTELGPLVPRIGTVVAPIPHDAIGSLPAGAAGALELSLARRPGKTVTDLVTEFGRVRGVDLVAGAEAGLKDVAKSSLADVDHALGDNLTFGVYLPTATPQGKALDALAEHVSLLGSLAIRDDAVVRALFAAAKKAIPPKDATFSEGRVVADMNKGKALVVRLTKNAVLFSVGDKADATRLISDAEKGTSPLSKTALFAEYQKSSVPSQISLFIDSDTLSHALPADQAWTFASKGTSTDFVFQPSTDGLDVALKGGGGTVAMLGAASALAIYGVNTYLAASKTAEAKNTVGAIARAAQSSFERETLSGKAIVHRLCPSARPVPATVPRGTTATIEPRVFADDPGWNCLRFSLDEPVRYRYEYRVGGSSKCTHMDLGPDGFEASAEGDLNGDGKTSLFCMMGKRDGDTMKVSTQIMIIDELE